MYKRFLREEKNHFPFCFKFQTEKYILFNLWKVRIHSSVNPQRIMIHYPIKMPLFTHMENSRGLFAHSYTNLNAIDYINVLHRVPYIFSNTMKNVVTNTCN